MERGRRASFRIPHHHHERAHYDALVEIVPRLHENRFVPFHDELIVETACRAEQDRNAQAENPAVVRKVNRLLLA